MFHDEHRGLNRRGFLTGLSTALITAPAIVRAASLMPVRGLVMPLEVYGRSPAMLELPNYRLLAEWQTSWLYMTGQVVDGLHGKVLCID